MMFPEFGDVEKEDNIEENKGISDEGLGGSTLPEDKEKKGSLLNDAINNGVSGFSADLISEMIIENFKMTKNNLGDSFLQKVTGYDPKYLEKNLKFPEFQREVRDRIKEKITQLEKDGLVEDGEITEKGFYVAGIDLYVEELDKLVSNNFYLGEKFTKDNSQYGDIKSYRRYKIGDSFKNIAVTKTIMNAIRQGKEDVTKDDLIVSENESKGNIEIIYALDTSGSMKGKKLEMCKKAGIALSFKAIENKDKVGLVLFGDEIRDFSEPSYRFPLLLNKIVRARALSQTNISLAIRKSIELFRGKKKHLLIISDFEPTIGDFPFEETIESINLATAQGISISLIGISLEKETEELAKEIIDITHGKLYLLKNEEELDRIVLEDYYGL